MVEVFHMAGMELVEMDRLKMLVRYSMPVGPRCLRCRVEIWSGPIALEGLAFFIASMVSLVLNLWVS